MQCLENPHKPQYNGGIIVNPELNDGLKAWSTFGDAKIEHRESDGNRYVVAYTRNNPHGSMSQKLYLKKNHLYTFSGIYAWLSPHYVSSRVKIGSRVSATSQKKKKKEEEICITFFSSFVI